MFLEARESRQRFDSIATVLYDLLSLAQGVRNDTVDV